MGTVEAREPRGARDEDKPFVVVSNNRRNKAFGSAIGVRITTTTPKAPRRSIVAIAPGEPIAGFVRCDDITVMFDDEPTRHAGALSPGAMRVVGDGIKAALDLS